MHEDSIQWCITGRNIFVGHWYFCEALRSSDTSAKLSQADRSHLAVMLLKVMVAQWPGSCVWCLLDDSCRHLPPPLPLLMPLLLMFWDRASNKSYRTVKRETSKTSERKPELCPGHHTADWKTNWATIWKWTIGRTVRAPWLFHSSSFSCMKCEMINTMKILLVLSS